jgi:hypothetical protein
VEYVFYVFFALCVMAVASVLVAERLRAASYPQAAVRTEVATRVLFLTVVGATIAVAWIVTARW